MKKVFKEQPWVHRVWYKYKSIRYFLPLFDKNYNLNFYFKKQNKKQDDIGLGTVAMCFISMFNF